jgi:hypothetical protein
MTDYTPRERFLMQLVGQAEQLAIARDRANAACAPPNDIERITEDLGEVRRKLLKLAADEPDIYVVMSHFNYEGDDLLDATTSEADAIAFAEAEIKATGCDSIDITHVMKDGFRQIFLWERPRS